MITEMESEGDVLIALTVAREVSMRIIVLEVLIEVEDCIGRGMNSKNSSSTCVGGV
jgi:hypothetical protein